MKNILFILLIFPFWTLSQEFTTSVSKNPVSAGEQFQISFTADGDIDQFRAPNFDGLRILSGPNQSSSSSVQMINGSFSQTKSVSYTYLATALNKGIIEIEGASAKVDGKSVKSNNVVLTVEKENPKSENNVLNLSDKVFIKTHINKTKLFQGEQLVVSYKLYSKINLADINITELPVLNGFWKEEVETSSRPTLKVIDGVNHNVWEISRMIVTPQRSGELEIDAMKATVLVQVKNNRRRNDPFSFFDSYQNIEEKLSSQSIKIAVLPLPPPPSNFSGAVGNFNLVASVDKTEVKENEAVNFKLTLSGSGNLHLIDKIEIDFPRDFEAYDPQLTDKTFTSKNGISGKKIFEHLLIPRFQGTYTIPSVDLTYFDTKSKSYQSVKTKAFDIKVSKGNQNNDNYQSSEKLQEQANSRFHGLKKEPKWILKKSTSFYKSAWYWFLLLVPLLSVLLFFIYQKWNQKSKGDLISYKHKKSLKTAQKSLKKASFLLKKEEKELFFEEIEKSLWSYFSDKFKVDTALLSKENIHFHFEKNGINKKTSAAFTNIIDDCEFCRFAPASLDASQMQSVYIAANQIIIDVETELKK